VWGISGAVGAQAPATNRVSTLFVPRASVIRRFPAELRTAPLSGIQPDPKGRDASGVSAFQGGDRPGSVQY